MQLDQERKQRLQQQEDSPEMLQLINRCRNVPFYRWRDKDHKLAKDIPSCTCFNHIIGLPEKGSKKYPMFDYEYMVFRSLMEPAFVNTRASTPKDEEKFRQLGVEAELKTNSKSESVTNAYSKFIKEKENTLFYPQKVGHIAILKSTGLGLTEFFLRYIAWNCLKDDKWKNRDVIILTGVRQELANGAISRLKKMFLPLGIIYESRNTTLFLNGCRIRAFPTENLPAIRGIPDPAMLYCDEASFFGRSSEVIDTLGRYAGKSSAQIVLTSTPNKPNDDDIMYKIFISTL